MKILRLKSNRGQTALEYALVIVLMILPMVGLIRKLIQDSGDNKNDSIVRKLVEDSYGDDKKIGMIGRPYP